MDDIIKEFLVESFESLDRLDQEFIALESDPTNTEILNGIFRTIHTIKGTCGFLSFSVLEKITHVGETLLDSLRAGRCQYTTEAASALLKLVDATRAILQNIEETGAEGEETYAELAAILTALNEATEESDASTENGANASITESSATLEAKEEHCNDEAGSSSQIETSGNHKASVDEPVSEALEASADTSGEPAGVDVADNSLGDLIDQLDQSLEKHRAAAAPSVSHDATDEVDLDALFAQGGELETSGSTEASEPVPAEEGVGTFDDLANHDLIAEIMGTSDFQALLDQEKAQSSGPKSTASTSTTNASPAQNDELVASKGADLDDQTTVVETMQISSPIENSTEEQLIEDQSHITNLDRTPKEKQDSAIQSSSTSSANGAKPSLSDTSLRVDVALLDEVMNLVGELVLARNQILQFTKTQTDSSFVNTCQRLNLITSELQEGVMKTRMQPIANVWNKFPRVVRDVAKACGKEIEIEMEGKDTELDKTILEAIKDPLTHIVRNSADHGIEDPDAREAKGKPRTGTLILKAYHEGGHVIIEIADDGAGLNTERIKTKAIEKGLISPEQAARLSEPDIQRLIFKPGFSTAEKITNVSGRGVGMDVVRSNIEKIGGQVDIQSQLDRGTTLSIKIPLTLAIVPALIVTCEEQRFAIPQVNLLELLRIEEDDVPTKIEEIKGSYFYRLRGNLLPLVYLSQELETRPKVVKDGHQGGEVNIVVVKAEQKEFGLIVEKVHDTEEIVVKPLGRQLKDIEVFSGATIMGDGKVALILDVFGLAKKARVVQDLLDKGAEEHAEEIAIEGSERQSLLLVGIGRDGRFAIPLNMVNRLEEFAIDDIEAASGRQVVQYRGGILPLIDLPSFFNREEIREHTVATDLPDHKSVVVFSEGGRFVGLIVDRVLDIVDERVEVSYDQGREGIQGSAIIQNKVTDLLDIHEVLKAREPGFFRGRSTSEMGA